MGIWSLADAGYFIDIAGASFHPSAVVYALIKDLFSGSETHSVVFSIRNLSTILVKLGATRVRGEFFEFIMRFEVSLHR